MQLDPAGPPVIDSIESPPVAAPQTESIHRSLPPWARALLSTPLALLGVVVLTVIVLAALLAPLLTPYAPSSMLGPLGAGPSPSHWFGTNDQGQDIFAQVVYGARFSLAVGLGTGLTITLLATAVGMLAGYIGGWIDEILSMVMNIFLVIPQLPLLIVISAYIPLKGDNAIGSVILMIGVITITGWAWGGRVIRSQTLTLRNRDFVKASIVSGESTVRVVFFDILPTMVSLLANTLIMSSMGAILTEAALDYLGVGNSTQVTWGNMLYRAQSGSSLFTGEWWSFIFPGLAIALTTMSMIFINNAVDAISNPRLRSLSRGRRRPWRRGAAIAGRQIREVSG
ncbi:MAG: ABC transporter permease [Chloroflexota bacterium]